MKFIRILKCLFGSHRFYTVLEIDCCNRKVGCKDCNRLWGMNDNVQAFVLWDGSLEEMYRLIGKIK